MTVQEAIEYNLVSRGIADRDTPEIMELIKDDESLSQMSERWSDDKNGYPKVLMSVVWIAAKRTALKWIDDNQPQAWFRPMFL